MTRLNWERRPNGILVGKAQIGQRHFECIVLAEEKRARWTFAGLPWNHFLEEFFSYDQRGDITFVGKMEDKLKQRCQEMCDFLARAVLVDRDRNGRFCRRGRR